ncbi:hypothetical protein N478_25760 [Pseudoalteromonas luteoviolacea S4060-1]|uniref:Uncharacterized protein n=1 Tax=Pseudoalteromonas luteoviolacea S4060-1 TaxID=1365257 RepID=A0A162BHQ6_9GAMM|nr:hypothetical protein N478_25760 [Pseudoalteromonas luteoviolacea S4060-1]
MSGLTKPMTISANVFYDSNLVAEVKIELKTAKSRLSESSWLG